MERESASSLRAMLRSMSAHLYGRERIYVPYTLPSYVLRRRATYGGRKGRRAVQRLKARGLGPVFAYVRSVAPAQNWSMVLA